MHAREMVELAAVVSSHGASVIAGPGRISSDWMQQYWLASKCRLEAWGRELKRLRENEPCDTPELAAYGSTARAVLGEIFTGEVFTRVWTAVVVAHDQRRGANDAEIIARSVLDGQLEARQRALRLLVEGPQLSLDHAIALNRLRRRSERWSDLLVGNLAVTHEVSQFAVHPERALAFAAELRKQSAGRQAGTLWLASLRMAFSQIVVNCTGNEETNARIAAAVLACFDSHLFDSTGILQSVWMARLSTAAADTQMLIDELFAFDDPGPALPASLDETSRGRLSDADIDATERRFRI